MPRNTLFFTRQAPTNLQTFTDALGGFKAPPIEASGDPKQQFSVEGQKQPDFKTASSASCSKQKNDCANAANGAAKGQFKVNDCDNQNNACLAAQASATVQDFSGGGGGGNTALVNTGPDQANPDFDLFCQQ
ncbi:hypothetical protein K491DRAFT_672509 [Lophiostoma macrostomum CBS 122681]|uniref:Uncharacterized protein n=1 Tax=Lophiostoma macrostomum CBS 122681 TaxID=1314788 RepID=A0A6A6SHL7_9PLEO|nr:hypothetical protein K491DRAFT_672509 [Lophiostoma macrostomum CBS 122681]